MARKTTLPDPQTPIAAMSRSAASPQRMPRRFSLRIAILLLLLLMVVGVGLALRGTELSLWWLSRQSTESLQTAASALPADATARYVYAKRLFDQGKYPDALAAFQEAEKALPPNSHDIVAQQTLAYLGYLWIRSGNDKQASGYLKHAQEMNDDDTRVHLGLGLLFMLRKQQNYAENQFKIVVHTDPKNAEGWFLLGKNYIEMSSYNIAVDPLTEAVKLDPKNPIYWEELGSAYANERLHDKAIPPFRKAYELLPNNIAYETALGSAMALNAHTQSEYQEATSVLEDCVRRAPEDDSAELAMGTLDTRFNNLVSARKHLRRLAQLSPNLEGGWFKLALVEQALGHQAAHDQAIRRFQQLSDFARALTVMKTKLGSDANNIALHVDLARFEWQHGDLTGALAQYQDGLARVKDAAVQREFEARAQEYKALLAKDPKGNYSQLKPPPFTETLMDSPSESKPNAQSPAGNPGTGVPR
ncbi:MAG TPA: tetratricopeptide repeat protein [Chthonomonadaceae bacterium]|nr:tetratricopeptide repeat protein [Chthonomonadaceae bacterium]